MLASVLLVGLPLLAVGVVAGSVWSEHRFPSDAPDASDLTRARGLVTRPVVGAVSEHVRRRVRSMAERRLELTGMELAEVVAGMNDPALSVEERHRHARRLGRVKSPEAITALIEALLAAPPEELAFFAQLLGSTGDPVVVPYLEGLLVHADDEVVIAALTGLCSIEGHDPSELIGPVLWDAERAAAVRIAAAVGLGHVGTDAARRQLEAAFDALPAVELRDQVLASLGRFPFPDVEARFRAMMSEDEPSDTRMVAAEALYHSTPDAVPFLLDVAASDPVDEVRESAAWAISGFEGALGDTLADLAEREAAPDVRRRLYEAQLSQREIPAARLLPRVTQEVDVAARVAGINAVGQAVGGDAPPEVAAVFDEQLVPELTRIAANPNSRNIRMRAVFALRRAGTDAAVAALRTIAATAEDRHVAGAAQNGVP